MRLLYHNITHTLHPKMAMDFTIKLYIVTVSLPSVFVLQSVFLPLPSIQKALNLGLKQKINKY